MQYAKLDIQVANIILVFDGLEDRQISRDGLRKALPGARAPIEIPGFTQMTDLALQAEISILWGAPTRIETKVMQPEGTDWELIPKLAAEARRSVKNAPLVTYGFNIFSKIELAGEAGSLLLDYFRQPIKSIGQQVAGQPVGMNFRLLYVDDKGKYQLDVAPDAVADNVLGLNLNIDLESETLPMLPILRKSYKEFRDYFYYTVEHLFEETLDGR